VPPRRHLRQRLFLLYLLPAAWGNHCLQYRRIVRQTPRTQGHRCECYPTKPAMMLIIEQYRVDQETGS